MIPVVVFFLIVFGFHRRRRRRRRRRLVQRIQTLALNTVFRVISVAALITL